MIYILEQHNGGWVVICGDHSKWVATFAEVSALVSEIHGEVDVNMPDEHNWWD